MRQDRLLAIFIFVLGLGAFLLAGTYPTGAQIFPRFTSGILIVAAVVLFFRREPLAVEADNRSSGATESPAQKASFNQMFAIPVALGLAVLYVIGVRWIGYITSSALYVPLSAYVLGLRNWVWIVAGTVIFVAASSVLFIEVFKAPLPPERLLTWF